MFERLKNFSMEDVKIIDMKNPYQILDDVLGQLSNTSSFDTMRMEDVYSRLQILDRLPLTDKHIIFQKLKKDGAINSLEISIIPANPNSTKETRWYITFEGILLLKDGGYIRQQEVAAARLERQESDRRVNIRNETLLWVATAVLAIIEGIKVLSEQPQFFFWYRDCH